jgi:hypothetical protein
MESTTEERWPIWGDTRWYRAVEPAGLSREQRIVLEHLLTLGNLTNAARASRMQRCEVRRLVEEHSAFRGALAAARRALLAVRRNGERADCEDSVFGLLRIW